MKCYSIQEYPKCLNTSTCSLPVCLPARLPVCLPKLQYPLYNGTLLQLSRARWAASRICRTRSPQAAASARASRGP